MVHEQSSNREFLRARLADSLSSFKDTLLCDCKLTSHVHLFRHDRHTPIQYVQEDRQGSTWTLALFVSVILSSRKISDQISMPRQRAPPQSQPWSFKTRMSTCPKSSPR